MGVHMSTTTEELGAEKWVEYFDSLTRGIEGMLVTIEVMSEELGDQLDVERLPLQAIGYDPKDNVLEVAVGVEKPLAHTIEEGFDLIKVWRESGKVCQVGTQNRSSALYKKAHE